MTCYIKGNCLQMLHKWNSPTTKVPMACYINGNCVLCLCWGLTSQSTIFQSCQDGATASWVINQYFRGVKCLAQGHNMAAVGFEPPTFRSGVRHATTDPPRSASRLNGTHQPLKYQWHVISMEIAYKCCINGTYRGHSNFCHEYDFHFMEWSGKKYISWVANT